MRVILRQLVVTSILTLALWYLLDLTLSRCPVMRSRLDTNDSSPSRSLLHDSQVAHLVGELHLLARTDRPKLVLLGGSSMQFALRPDQVERLLPEYEVHNLALNGAYGGGSIAEGLRIMMAARDTMSPEAREGSVFVYGVVIQTFVAGMEGENASWFDSARLTMFPRLYRQTDLGVEARFGRATPGLLAFVRPFFAVRQFLRIVWETRSVACGLLWVDDGGESASVAPAGHDGVVAGPDEATRRQIEAMCRRAGSDGFFSDVKFRDLRRMLEFARARGLRCIVVALPYAPWVKRRYPVYDRFLGRLRATVEAVEAGERIRYMDLSDLLPDGDFLDSSHVLPSGAPHCAQGLWKQWPF